MKIRRVLELRQISRLLATIPAGGVKGARQAVGNGRGMRVGEWE